MHRDLLEGLVKTCIPGPSSETRVQQSWSLRIQISAKLLGDAASSCPWSIALAIHPGPIPGSLQVLRYSLCSSKSHSSSLGEEEKLQGGSIPREKAIQISLDTRNPLPHHWRALLALWSLSSQEMHVFLTLIGVGEALISPGDQN